MAERYSSFAPGGTAWLLQRVTAAFLIAALAFHFFQLHFLTHAWEIEFAGTRARMDHLGYLLAMILFLWAAAFHGVNGIYNALVNQGLSGTPKRVVLAVLVLAGAALVVQGTYVALVMGGFA